MGKTNIERSVEWLLFFLMYALGIFGGMCVEKKSLLDDLSTGKKWIEFNSQGEASWVERKGK